MPRKVAPDVWLFGVVMALVFLGVVMVYSASAIIAADRFDDPFFFLKKQLFWALLGGGLLWGALRLDYRRLERLVIPLLVLSFVLLVLVLVPPFGQSINGTRRWIRLGALSFQPVELAKFSLVLYLASFLTRRREEMRSFWHGLFPILLVAGTMALLDVRAARPRQQPGPGGADPRARLPGGRAREAHGADRGRRAAPRRPRRRAQALSLAPHARVRQSLGRPPGLRLPDHPVLPGPGLGRALRARARRVEAEALLPARAVHGLHLRHPRRGAGAGGRRPRDRPLRAC